MSKRMEYRKRRSPAPASGPPPRGGGSPARRRGRSSIQSGGVDGGVTLGSARPPPGRRAGPTPEGNGGRPERPGGRGETPQEVVGLPADRARRRPFEAFPWSGPRLGENPWEIEARSAALRKSAILPGRSWLQEVRSDEGSSGPTGPGREGWSSDPRMGRADPPRGTPVPRAGATLPTLWGPREGRPRSSCLTPRSCAGRRRAAPPRFGRRTSAGREAAR